MMEYDRVFITGVSSGIGAGLAEKFLGFGSALYGVSRHTPENLIGKKKFHFRAADLARTDELPEILTALLEGVTGLDLVVLNAGILGRFGDMHDVPLATMKRVMDVNLWANKAVLDHLMKRVPDIRQVVAVSSGASVSGNRGWNAYALSKCALNMMVRLYAREFPETHFSAFAPGLVDTAMQDYLCGLPESDTHPTLAVIKGRRNTSHMPNPASASDRFIRAFSELFRSVKSGEYTDIRKME